MKVCPQCQIPLTAWHCEACNWAPELRNGFLHFATELADNNSGFDPTFFKHLAELEQKHFWFNSRNRLIIKTIQKYFPTAENLFEVGCGTGFVLSGIRKDLPKLQLFGSEIYTKGLHFAKHRLPEVELFQMDARNIPYADEFDLLGAFDVLEHIEEDQCVLQQFHKCLKNGGGLILTVPQHPFLWSSTDEKACHVRRYTFKKLKENVISAGFAPLWTTSFVTLLFPLMLIARFKRSRSADPYSELRLPAIQNTALDMIMRAELALISAGCNLPFGGSRIMLARKI